MADRIVFSVAGKLLEHTIDPILCQFKYMFCYNRKIETLRDKVKDLEIKEYDMQQLVVEARRNAEDIKPSVTDWLQKVDGLKKQAYEVLESVINSKIQCLSLTYPNLKTRYSLGRKATKKIVEAAKLLVEGTFQRVGETKQLVQTPYQNPSDFGAFETRISMKREIMEALKNNDVGIIGICGMPGAGKTTMANEIANQVKFDKLFDDVAFTIVSQDTEVTKIQDRLAEALGLNSMKEKSNENVRAGLLRERLGGDASKSVLVILDDVWECIELGNIGIPVPSAGDGKRLKILLTSRHRDVSTNMGAQEIFEVDVLNPRESWELFKGKAEIADDATDVIKRVAEEVASECKGLPIALVTVGRALRKRAEYSWKNALEELRNSRVKNIDGMHKLVYSRIQFSYNYLESDEAKSLLLLCSLFPEDFSLNIEDLVRYAWGLELFRDTMTFITARDKVNSIVDNLKSCYLLLSGEDEECVKLHDVVRDVCLEIASKDKHAYVSKHGLKEWPKHDNNESYSAIFLTFQELNHLPSGLEYPNLKELVVKCKHQSLNISKDCFADMKELRVLDFTCTGIQIPPSIRFLMTNHNFTSTRIQISSSIQLLTNLRTLCLGFFTLSIEISTIGKLKMLEVLSFLGSDLDHFPDDIAELNNLRLLDLRLQHSCPLPPGILEKLTKLEELYMGVVEIGDDEFEQRGYIIEEISSLTGLNTFQISTNDPQFLLQILHVLCIEKLERFHIMLTDFKYDLENIFKYYYFRRRFHIRGITHASILSQPAINLLMWRAEHLFIEMDMNMSDEDGLEHLNGNHPTWAFDRLQEITLWGIPRMKHLWRGVIGPPSFCNLTILKIEFCPSVKSLFSETVALCMVNLQSISISDCEMLEEIVSTHTEQNEVTQMLEFPKLQEIRLEFLRNFKSFRSGSNKLAGVHNPLFKQVTFPNLESLYIRELGCTVKILIELRHIRCHKLRALDVERLDYVSIMFDFEYTKDDIEISILSQLTSLKMRYLPNLVHITRMFPSGTHIFENLTRLEFEKCDNLRYLFPSSMANSLVSLKYLWVVYCEALEEIIGRQEEDGTSNIELVEEGMTSRIVFPNLCDLRLRCLDRFTMISSQNYETLFPSLEYLQIENCPIVTKFCSRQSAPKLDEVWLNYKEYVDTSNFFDSEGNIDLVSRARMIIVDSSRQLHNSFNNFLGL